MVYLKDIDIIKMKQHQLYWLELWEELLNQFTIDEYKVPEKNLYGLCEELRDEKDDKGKKRIFEEIKNSEIGLKKDKTATHCNNSLINFFSDNNEFAIEKIQNMHYLKESVYFEEVAFNLYEILSSDNEENIEDLTALTKIFIAGLIYRKYSSYYLQTRAFLFTKGCFKGANFQFRLNYLFSYLLKDKSKWFVLFKVTLKKDVLNLKEYQDLKFLSNQNQNIKKNIENLKQEENDLKSEQNKLKNKENIYATNSSPKTNIRELKDFQFKSKNNLKKLERDIEKEINFLTKSDGKIFIKLTNIEASDPYSISKIAKNKLLRFMHIIRYNSPNISFSVTNIDSNILIENEKISILVAKEKSFDYRKKLTFRKDKINRHFEYIDKCKSEILKYDFQDIMHFYGMYLDGQYDSEKFLSLWIALERLCDISQGGKGSTVAEDVSSMVTLSHLKKVLINLWHDLDRLVLSKILIDNFLLSMKNNKIKEEELFFLIKDKHKELLQVIEKESSSKLIYKRIEDLSKKFKTANNLKEYISNYKISVENSLWRLYSIRNKITHEAYIDSDLSLYLTQLDYFFKITYSNLLFASTLKSFNSRRDIFEIYNGKYLKIWGKSSKINMDKLDKEEFRNLILEPFNIYK